MGLEIHGVRPSTLARWLVVAISICAFVGCGRDESELGGAKSMPGRMATDDGSFSGVNGAPIIQEVLLRPVRPSPGREVRVMARVSDPDGDPTTVEYRWQTTRGRLLGSGRTFDTTGLEPGSRLELIATPSDGRTTGVSITHEFSLSEPSLAIGLVVIDTSEGTKPGVVLESVVELLNDDSDRAEAELEWQVNGKVVGSAEELETAGFQPGDVVVLRARLHKDDGGGRFIASPAVVLSRGGAPEISSRPLAGIEGGMFRYQIRASSDEPDAELTYALLSGPEGMSVDEKSGFVTWRPSSEQRGRFDVEVSATDQWGSGTAQSFAIVADAPGSSPASAR